MSFCLNIIERLRLRRLFRLIPPTDFTAGSVIFSGSAGVFAQDNANLFFDDSLNYLGLGINSAIASRLHVAGDTLPIGGGDNASAYATISGHSRDPTSNALGAYTGTLNLQSTSPQNQNVGAGIAFQTKWSTSAGTQATMSGIFGAKENNIEDSLNGYLSFSTRKHGDVVRERVRITSDGNVGVNTTTPTDFGTGYRCLQINGTNGGIFRSNANNGTTVADFFAESGIGAVLRTTTNHPVIISANSIEVLYASPDKTLRQATLTVATLPAAGTAGRRGFVTDANATTFASIVAGGGANKVPVYDDGTNWRIG